MLLNPFNRRLRQDRGFPVFPGAFPVVGHLPAIATGLLDLFRRAEREIGPHFWLDMGFIEQELVCLQPDAFALLKNKVTTSPSMAETAPAFTMLGDTLILLDGQPHRDIRSAMNNTFQPSGLSAAEIGQLFAPLIERKVGQWRLQREVCLLRETRELGLALMFRMLDVEESDFAVWRKKYEQFVSLLYAPPIDLPGMPLRRGRLARDWIDGQLRDFMRDVRAKPDSRGMLAALVRSFDSGDAALSAPRLIANLRLLVLAGHETSASIMAWMVINLAQQPDAWDALCAEAAAIGAPPRTPKELAGFPYAEALFRETLRLYPPAPVVRRRALADFDFGGRTLSAGMMLSIPVLHLSRHAELYERPDEFLPQRWLGRKESVKPIEMVQFGGGPHFCLGYHLAWLEIVQFAIALALTMAAGGLRPRLTQKGSIAPRYLPLLHPPPSLRVVFE